MEQEGTEKGIQDAVAAPDDHGKAGDTTDHDWDAAFAEAKAAESEGRQDPEAEAGKIFDDFSTKRPPQKSDRSLDFILDIPLEVSVELGRTRMVINDLLQIGQGAIVELDKLAGEPVEVFVNGRLLGKGEVVVVDEKFGVRLTEIISPAERVKSLG